MKLGNLQSTPCEPVTTGQEQAATEFDSTTKEQPRRCGAKTRGGWPCRSYGMPNGRCKLHGGKSTGAPKGNKNAWKHGRRSREYRSMRQLLRLMLAELTELADR